MARTASIFAGCLLVAVACASASGSSAPAPRVTLDLTPIDASSMPTTAAPTTGGTTRPTSRPTVTAAPRPPTTARPTTAPSSTASTTSTIYIPKSFAPVTDMSATPLTAIGQDSGAETKRVQGRLIELGFWLSAIDGRYGLATSQAVMAFQKYYGLDRSGSVDAATARALTAAVFRSSASATDGTLVEIDKRKQLLFLVEDGRTIWIFNTSTGSGKHYREVNLNTGRLEEDDAITPDGQWTVTRERPSGWWAGDLGKIYRPKYFHGGIAIHGMNNVPGYPASHGCVRLSLPAMDFIWANGLVPKGSKVWVHGGD